MLVAALAAALLLAACGSTNAATPRNSARPGSLVITKLAPIQVSAVVDQLEGVSCSSASYCLAVGSMGTGSESFSGSIEHLVQTEGPTFPASAGPTFVTAVSCIANNQCFITGNTYHGTPFLAQYTNSHWSSPILFTRLAKSGAAYTVHALSCNAIDPAGYQCLLGGTTKIIATGAKEGFTLKATSVHPNGAATILRTPSNYVGSSLLALTCSTQGCAAAGSYISRSGNQYPMLVLTSGSDSHWTQASFPSSLDHRQGALTGIDCTADGSCVGVGYQTTASYSTEGLIVSRTSNSWKSQTVADPTGGNYLFFSSVSCTEASCYLGGEEDFADTVYQLTLPSLTRDIQQLPFPVTGNQTVNDGDIESMWCDSADACIGVGGVNNLTKSSELNLAVTLKNGAWSNLSVQSASHPSLASALGDVYCFKHSTGCLVTATAYDTGEVLAYTPSGQLKKLFGGDDYQDEACFQHGECVAVGVQNNSPLIESFSPSSPNLTASPVPVSTQNGGALNSIACLNSHTCYAVGYLSYNYDLPNNTQAHRSKPYILRITENDPTAPTVVPAASPVNTSGASSGLDLVACRGDRTCYAVGTSTSSYGSTESHVFIDMSTTSGTQWQAAPTPLSDAGALNPNPEALACTSSECILTEVPSFAGGTSRLAIYVLRSHQWSTLALPQSINDLQNVAIEQSSCESNTCIVTGSATDNYGRSEPIVLKIEGTSISILNSSDAVPGGGDGTGSGVSCARKTCLIVGYANPPTGFADPWIGRVTVR